MASSCPRGRVHRSWYLRLLIVYATGLPLFQARAADLTCLRRVVRTRSV